MIWEMFFSKKVLLSPFALLLYALHTVGNLTAIVENLVDEKPYGYLLWRLPFGYLVILGILFLFVCAGYVIAKNKIKLG